MLRPADELRKAAASLKGKPVLIEHQEVTADAHPHRAVVGSIGSDVVFDGTAVRASLSFWTRDSIDAIEHGGQRSLSAGYYYEPEMTFRNVTGRGVRRHYAIPKIQSSSFGGRASRARRNGGRFCTKKENCNGR